MIAIAVLSSMELVDAKGRSSSSSRSGYSGSSRSTTTTSRSYRAASYYTSASNYRYTDSFGAVIVVNYGTYNYYYDYQYG